MAGHSDSLLYCRVRFVRTSAVLSKVMVQGLGQSFTGHDSMGLCWYLSDKYKCHGAWMGWSSLSQGMTACGSASTLLVITNVMV